MIGNTNAVTMANILIVRSLSCNKFKKSALAIGIITIKGINESIINHPQNHSIMVGSC
jgi:hypothetical protein